MKASIVEKRSSTYQFIDMWNNIKANLSIKKIGMRNVKTGLAVALSIAVSKMLKMDYPFFAAIAAIVSMQSSVIESFNEGRNRMIGTLIGAAVSLIGTLIAPNNIIMILLGIIIVIYLLNVLNYKKSIVIGCIVFLAIAVNLEDESPFLYSIDRIIDTIIGISIAALINYFVMPPDLLKKANKQCEKVKSIILKIVEKEMYFSKDYNPKVLLNNISLFENTLNICEIEPNLKNNDKVEIDNMKKILMYSKKIQLHMNVLDFIKVGEISGNNKETLEQLPYYKEKETKDHITSEGSKIDVVYNYHLNAITRNLDKIKEIRL